MSRLYDIVEPSVIDDKMLMQLVEEQGPKNEAGRLAKEEGIDFCDVTTLRLDFRNILKIDGLWEFVNLTVLQLDNNIIEKIEGIDKLVNLVWLDLSFNNIEVIEGLDTLTKLEDLTLYNNRISRIENMDALRNLEVFSIGNNNLTDLENLIYLRRFSKLRTLNLSNNPLCTSDNYKEFVGAFLPNLTFLDYHLLDDHVKAAGYEQHTIQVEEILDDDRKERAKQEEAENQAKLLELHKKAYVECFDGDRLFDTLYSEDPDGQTLNEMPGTDEAFADMFRQAFTAVCEKIFRFGLDEHKKREEEVAVFWECVEEAKRENKDTGIKAVEEFNLEKKRLFTEITYLTDPKLVEQKVKEYNSLLAELWDKLMGHEMQLVDQLEEVVQNFDRSMQEHVINFIEQLQGYLVMAREVENNNNERVVEIAHIHLDRVMKNDMDDLPDELQQLLVDKDTIMTAVQASHDAHLLKIDNKEDEIVKRINSWLKNMIEKIHDEEEIKRNRAQVIQINYLIDHFREEIDNLEMDGDGQHI